jgi:hypothetical protein
MGILIYQILKKESQASFTQVIILLWFSRDKVKYEYKNCAN